ncbi:MAG: hypothetical protein AUG02_06995 [Chloroflexi bacterium 13_1_20CM_2_70_9]|nr:MAG: hypothetical protein AUG02_06995 [Chloroflexi bacterium 13_1_20CM_2_70_9]
MVVVRADEGRLRVIGRGETGLAPDAVTGGLVTDRAAVGAALATAFAAAERSGAAERAIVALDGDDVRTFHVRTTFERANSTSAIVSAEMLRAMREAHEAAAAHARAAVEDDPALRGVATARLRDEVAALSLDGRPLASLVGYRGRAVEVHTDVSVAPLVLSGAALAAVADARRRATTVSGSYALARLVVESGTTDAGVVRLGADVTSLAIIRDSRVVGTRAFGLGRGAFVARGDTLAPDARVWAECVATPLAGYDGPLPERWLFIGVPDALQPLATSLAEVVGGARGGPVRIGPLAMGSVGRVFADVPVGTDDLVAVGAAALGTGAYA